VLVPTVDLSEPPPRPPCSEVYRYKVEVWDWSKTVPPSAQQFEWYDGYYGGVWGCGIEKWARDEFDTQWQLAQKSKASFAEAMQKRLDEIDKSKGATKAN